MSASRPGSGRAAPRPWVRPADAPALPSRPDIPDLFRSLAAMGEAMTGLGPKRTGQPLDHDTFEELTDHLLMVETDAQFGRSRYLFCGATVAENSKVGDVTDARIGDLMGEPTLRPILAGYRHVNTMRTTHVTRNEHAAGGTHSLYTRLILPLFVRERVVLMLSAVVFHDEPVEPADCNRAPP